MFKGVAIIKLIQVSLLMRLLFTCLMGLSKKTCFAIEVKILEYGDFYVGLDLTSNRRFRMLQCVSNSDSTRAGESSCTCS